MHLKQKSAEMPFNKRFFATIAACLLAVCVGADADCNSITNVEGCIQSSCAWCKSAAVHSACYTLEQSHKLPASIFECQVPSHALQSAEGNVESAKKAVEAEATEALEDGDCHDNKEHDACLSAQCAWCKSAAVKSSCYTIEQSYKLPASIFACEVPAKKKVYSSTANEVDCHAIGDVGECHKAKCSWCKSAAVHSACYDTEKAKKLPASIFSCSTEEQMLVQ